MLHPRVVRSLPGDPGGIEHTAEMGPEVFQQHVVHELTHVHRFDIVRYVVPFARPRTLA